MEYSNVVRPPFFSRYTRLAGGRSLTYHYSELIHAFPHPVPAAASAVTCMVQSPAIDVIGVGYLDGNVHLFDVRQDELVMQMKMEDGAVSSLSFRTGKSCLCNGPGSRRLIRLQMDRRSWLLELQMGQSLLGT